MSAYTDQQLAPLNSGMRNLTSGLQRLAYMRGMAGMRAPLYAAEAQDAQARQGLIGAQTATEKAKTAEIMQRLNLTTALQQMSPAAVQALAAGKSDDPSLAPYLGAAMAMTGENKGDIMKAGQTAVGLLRSSAGNITGAAGVVNPVSVANNAADNAEKAGRPVVVPTGGTMMTPTGTPIGTGGVTLNPGQTRFAPQGNLSAGMAPGNASLASDELGEPDATSAATPTPAAMTPVASGAPLPVKPGGMIKPPVNPLSSPEFQTSYYKSLIDEGTNAPDALNLVKALAPAQANPATPAAPQIPQIHTQEDYDALPPGSQYVDSLGRTATKRGK